MPPERDERRSAEGIGVARSFLAEFGRHLYQSAALVFTLWYVVYTYRLVAIDELAARLGMTR